MNIQFFGAVREVTGSMHLIRCQDESILLDCGLIQGRRKESENRNTVFPVSPKLIRNVILSHAHIDHSGRLPLFVKKGFSGKVFCTRATADACEHLLLDSAHIQESDAAYLNYKTARNALIQMKSQGKNHNSVRKDREQIHALLKTGQNELNLKTIDELLRQYRLDRVEPLYTIPDAEAAIAALEGIPYRYPVSVGARMSAEFYDAGHILGSAMVLVRISENGSLKRVLFTGDIGRFDMPLLKNPTTQFPEEDRRIDLLIMESTYGNREHEPGQDLKERLKEILTETVGRGGTLLIPAFAYGRTQDILYRLHELYDEKAVPKVPIFVDSPLASRITKVFAEHPEVFDDHAHKTFLEKGENPFRFDRVTFIESVEASMALMRDEKPHIVIAGSGMCEAGRILHHLRYKIHQPQHTILIVGYMAENTLGRRIQEKGLEYEAGGRSGTAPIVRFLNKEYPLKAHVVRLGGFSAHADKKELMRFLKETNLTFGKIAVVHGEEEQSLAMEEALVKEGFQAFVPFPGQSVDI
uniref:MBL fold metallo-hydrolase n=1 Tax=Desulfatirhabdium butyrativorans TaxID=340467 RepID=A0A7C4RSG0_9BACT